MQLELVFVEHKIESYSKVLAELSAKGLRKIVVCGHSEILNEFIINAGELAPHAQVYHPVEGDVHIPLDENTAVFLFETSPALLSAMLMDYADATAGVVCAPVTAHHMSHRAALANSIPKAGTHLLFELLKAFGFQSPPDDNLPSDNDKLESGHYYSLQHMTREHLARPVHTMERFVGGFCHSPILFMIRDPKDVAVSLAHYLSVQTDYHILQSYFANLPTEKRLLAVIRGDYPLPVYINRNMCFAGSIRDLYLAYADWARYPLANTILMRFEDLIGPRGGGDHRRQSHSIWTAQLALHVPGSPSQFAAKIFSPSSITFRKGQIGSYKDEFNTDHWAAFESLCPDFLELFGYDGITIGVCDAYPFWRGFHGEITIDCVGEHPQLLKEDYQGFNLIAYDGKVWAAAMAAGPVDFHDTGARERLVAEGRLLKAMTVDGARGAVDRLLDRQALEAEMSSLGSRIDAVASNALPSIDRRLSELEQFIAQQVSAMKRLDESHKSFDTKLTQAEATVSQLSAQQVEIANRHDATLSQLARWQEETEMRLVRDEAMIPEYSSGLSYRFTRWIRRLLGIRSPSARDGKNRRPLSRGNENS